MASPKVLGLPGVLGLRVLGTVFVGLLVLGVFMTYAVFNKTFVSSVDVDLKTSRIGLQMQRHADVKVRGVTVGEVSSVETSGDGAIVHLALDPDQVDLIPENVTARILPKTLLGEKYVELDLPDSPSTVTLADGGTINQADVSIEVEQVLSDTYPLLTAVQPAAISYTLNALSTALEGRGSDLGDNLVRLDHYLTQLNPLVPATIDDLKLLSKVAKVYREVLPDLARVLDNTVLTGHTIVEKRKQLTAFLLGVSDLSDTTRTFLLANEDAIIELSQVSRPTLEVLAKYAPEYPCLTQGLVNWIPRASEAFRGHTFHINLEPLAVQPRGYTPGDNPVYNATNGPGCASLPNPPYSQQNPTPAPDFDDGVAGQ